MLAFECGEYIQRLDNWYNTHATDSGLCSDKRESGAERLEKAIASR